MAQKPQVLRGFRDLLPRRMRLTQRVIRTATDVFERFGFEPLATPALEYAETLAGKSGEETDTLFYRFLDRGQREIGLALRPDRAAGQGVRDAPRSGPAVQALPDRQSLARRASSEGPLPRVLPMRRRYRRLQLHLGRCRGHLHCPRRSSRARIRAVQDQDQQPQAPGPAGRALRGSQPPSRRALPLSRQAGEDRPLRRREGARGRRRPDFIDRPAIRR